MKVFASLRALCAPRQPTAVFFFDADALAAHAAAPCPDGHYDEEDCDSDPAQQSFSIPTAIKSALEKAADNLKEHVPSAPAWVYQLQEVDVAGVADKIKNLPHAVAERVADRAESKQYNKMHPLYKEAYLGFPSEKNPVERERLVQKWAVCQGELEAQYQRCFGEPRPLSRAENWAQAFAECERVKNEMMPDLFRLCHGRDPVDDDELLAFSRRGEPAAKEHDQHKAGKIKKLQSAASKKVSAIKSKVLRRR